MSLRTVGGPWWSPQGSPGYPIFLCRSIFGSNSVPAKHLRRLAGKQKVSSFAKGWQWYIRNNIVSRHQQGIIVSFMSVNSGKSSTDQQLDASLSQGTHGSRVFLEYDNEKIRRSFGVFCSRCVWAGSRATQIKKITKHIAPCIPPCSSESICGALPTIAGV